MNKDFNCPKCGAPGEVVNGAATYTCFCRLGTVVSGTVGTRPPMHPLMAPGPVCPLCYQQHSPLVSCGFQVIASSAGAPDGR